MTDLSNVVPFARPRRAGAAAPFPLPSVAADERPAPYVANILVSAGIAFFAVSLALHSALLAMFWHEPGPRPSIGVESMSVEIVIGATAHAGAEPTPGEQESVPAPQAEERTDDKIVTAASRATTVMPQEVPVAAEETAPEAQPQTIPEVQTVEPKPQEQPPETAAAELQESTEPTERTQTPRPQIQAVQKAPERKRIDAPKDKKAAQKNQVATASPSNSASSVGIGRSDKSVNYPGIVRAHLVRYKKSPSGTAGTKGVAAVQFLLDGSGRVTSARLVKSSGVAAFDQEIVAMARRASPFPPPPPGAARDFNVSVTFEVR